jgi:hypothetical protein
MRPRTKQILFGLGTVVVLYFAFYFASVRTTIWEHKGVFIPSPVYRPFDGSFVHAVFTQAQLIDAAYFRRTLGDIH